MSDYQEGYSEVLRYSRQTRAYEKLLGEFNSDDHKLTRLGQGDPVLRLALAKLLRQNGREREAGHLENLTQPVHVQQGYLAPGSILPIQTRERHHIDPMERSYLETALWSSTHTPTDADGNEDHEVPLDRNHGIEDIEPETLGKLLASVHHFRSGLPPHLREIVDDEPEHAGRHLWLTQHSHGDGFWNGEWNHHNDDQDEHLQDVGGELTKHAQRLPEHNLYAENGQVRE